MNLAVSALKSSNNTQKISFDKFGLQQPLVEAIAEHGWRGPTVIQERCIPQILDGASLFGLSYTGTGKTGAYLLPILNNLLTTEGKGLRALILAPTRELTQQIGLDIKNLSKYTSIKSGIVYGGMCTPAESARDLDCNPDIISGAPGRIRSLLRSKDISFLNLEYLVLDEVDLLINQLGEKIFSELFFQIPRSTKLLCFSATCGAKTTSFMDHYGPNCKREDVRESQVTTSLSHYAVICPYSKKLPVLANLIRENQEGLTLVFVNRRDTTFEVGQFLKLQGFSAAFTSGDLDQNERNQIMQSFKNGEVNVLVATNLAARGLDVKNLTRVIHFDCPNNDSDYLHRSGRTGRAGKHGDVFAVADFSERYRLDQIFKNLDIVPTIIQVSQSVRTEDSPFSGLKMPGVRHGT